MPTKPKKLRLEPPLTEEEKARLYPLGITEEKIVHAAIRGHICR